MIQGSLRLVWVWDNHGLRWVLEKAVSIFWAETCAGSLRGTLEVPAWRHAGAGSCWEVPGWMGVLKDVGGTGAGMGVGESWGFLWVPGQCWGLLRSVWASRGTGVGGILGNVEALGQAGCWESCAALGAQAGPARVFRAPGGVGGPGQGGAGFPGRCWESRAVSVFLGRCFPGGVGSPGTAGSPGSVGSSVDVAVPGQCLFPGNVGVPWGGVGSLGGVASPGSAGVPRTVFSGRCGGPEAVSDPRAV